MSEPSERIHAALRRFKAARATAEGQRVKSIELGESAHQFIVVNEQNLAALFLTSTSSDYPKAPPRELEV